MKKPAVILCVVMMPALLYSKFLMSLVMIGLFLLALLDISWKPFSFKINPQLLDNLKSFSQNWLYLSFTLFFFLVLLTGIVTDDWFSFLTKLRIKLPFLILPFAFWCLPRFTKRDFLGILYALLLTLTIESFFIVGNFIINFEELYAGMKVGKPIPTPMHHIRFSLLCVVGVIAGWELWREGFYSIKKWEQWLIKGMTVYMVLFIHFLSVRSGWLSLYAALGYLMAEYIISHRKWLLGVAALIGAVSLPLLAINTIPSVKMKVQYMLYDWEQSRKGQSDYYSDSQRLVSYKLGMEIGKENPVLGVGYGDVKAAIEEKYVLSYPDFEKRIAPHNQFIYTWAGSGIVGVILLLAAFFTPFFYKKYRQFPILVAFYLAILCSFLPENTLESAIGIAIFLVFSLMFINYRE